MEIYKVSLDTTAWIMTAFIFLFVIIGILMTFIVQPFYAGFIVMAVPLLLIVFTYPYRVDCYEITHDSLVIKRGLAGLNRLIPFAEIESVGIPQKEDFRWTIRTMGNGGLFGYYGWYYNKKLGDFRMYATNKNRILILLKNATHEKIVISPDDITLAEHLQKLLKK